MSMNPECGERDYCHKMRVVILENAYVRIHSLVRLNGYCILVGGLRNLRQSKDYIDDSFI